MSRRPMPSPQQPHLRALPTLLRAVCGCIAAATFTACGDAMPVAPASNISPAALAKAGVTEPVGGPWARVVEGKTGPGSRYALYVPRSWNGDAVYYAHGFRDAESPVDLRDQDALYATRDQLGAQGFAVAYSSYSENGFAVKDGAQRTHQLRGRLNAELPRQPEHSFLLGHSLGGAIALDLAERYPSQYDGALLVCGMVGGSMLQTQYLGHVRALFDFYFPGAVPGNVLGVPAGTVVTPLQVSTAVSANPAGLLAIASTAQAPLPFVPGASAFPTLVGSLYGALSFHARGINNILDLTHGHSPFDNSTTQYSVGTPLLLPSALSGLLAAANAGVMRYDMASSARNYLGQHFTPSGDLRIPVLTMHNTWDPGVPAFHETALLQAVQAAGGTDFLVQRQVPTFGHCNIPSSQVLQAFADLTSWSRTGVKP